MGCMPDGGSVTPPSAGVAQEVHTMAGRRPQHSRTTRKTVLTHHCLLMIFTYQPYLVWRHGIARIAPTVAHIGEHMRHLLIGELHDGGHHAVIVDPVDHD